MGNKGVDIIREACRVAGYDLLTVDAAQLPPGAQAQPQSWVRDNLYHRASVYICASEWEGTPNPALEALACGLPVISTRVGNMPELIVDGHNGFLVERSSASVAQALFKLKGLNPDELRKNALATIAQGWSWKQQSKKYDQMFRELKRRKLSGSSKTGSQQVNPQLSWSSL